MIVHTEHTDKSWRVQAAYRVTENWRIRKRLPLITRLAVSMGLIRIEILY